ncbi:iron-containing alcohol dehydrogenase [Rhizobium beringeri]|uniref:iron-containing alcohol dehydrogenase n=1 Tax=Rhizobium beringeri TaxID=3019934 RepID=UPI003990871E
MAWGGAKRLGEIIAARFGARKVLLVTDGGLVKAGLIAPIAASLEAAGFSVAIFDRVVPDPPESVLYGCVEEARQVAADIVIGLGGGSSLDIAKLAAVLLSSAQPLAEMYGIGKVQGGAFHWFSFRQLRAPVPKSPTFPSSPPARRPRWESCRRNSMRISCSWMRS